MLDDRTECSDGDDNVGQRDGLPDEEFSVALVSEGAMMTEVGDGGGSYCMGEDQESMM